MSWQNKFYDAPEPDKVVFEVVFSEKEGGGTVDVTELDGDLPAGSVVGLATGNIYKPIKGATLVKAIGAEDTNIEIAKGSGFKQGEFIAFGGKAVAITAINSSDASKDVLTTAAFGTTVAIEAKGYQAKSAKASGAEAIYTPAYLTGNKLEGGTVNNFVRLVNGASVRAVTTNIAPEILANLKSINLV